MVSKSPRHRAGRRDTPGALPVEHQGTGGLRLDEHRVEGPPHAGQRVRQRHQRGVHPDDHARRAAVRSRAQLGDGQQLDDVIGLRGPRDVVGRDRRDALPMDVGGADPRVESQRGQDRSLGGGVVPLDVGRRVRLGEALLLRLLDGKGQVLAGGGHLVQDVVRGAVHDPQHPGDPVASQGLPHRADQRDRPADGGLEVQVDPGRLGRGVERRAVLAEQLLVRGHDRCPGFERGEQQGPRRLDAADQLDHDVGPGHQLCRVGGDQVQRDHRVARHVEAALRDPDEPHRRTDARRKLLGVGQQQPGDLRADGAAPQQCDANRVLCCHLGNLTVIDRADRPMFGRAQG